MKVRGEYEAADQKEGYGFSGFFVPVFGLTMPKRSPPNSFGSGMPLESLSISAGSGVPLASKGNGVEA
jgi:hypothetical protein